MALALPLRSGFTTELLHPPIAASSDRGLRPPIQPSVTYSYDDAADLIDIFQGRKSGYRYSRQSSPTVTTLEERITYLEKAHSTLCFATGMAAIAGVFQALLQQGDHIIASQQLFGNTLSQFQTLQRLGVDITFTDTTNSDNVAAQWQPNTRFVFTESISNPLTQIADIEGIAKLCQHKNALFIVDSTLTPPAYFLPLLHKVGLVIHSLSKYFGGHGAVLGGCVTDTGTFDWAQWRHRIPQNMHHSDPKSWGITLLRNRSMRDHGATLSPQGAERIMLGMETMGLRLQAIQHNACALAEFLYQHPKVKVVYHPSLTSHPEHQRAQTVLKTYGGLLSFELEDAIDPVTFLNALTLVHNATHLGDNHTLAIAVAQTIFYNLGATKRNRVGIAENLIRVSVGIDDPDLLLNDFSQALG